MQHHVFHLQCAEKDREVVLALCSELPFNAFAERHDGWEAYAENTADPQAIADALRQLQSSVNFTFSRHTIAHQNWNARWEAGFQPITVGRFCRIRAPFHPAQAGADHELIIEPRMAFGTGHHATTYLMIAAMAELPLTGARVLDYGSGTGVLAILAARCGADPVDAVDIEADAYENTLDNARVNGVRLRHLIQGELSDAPPGPYDIVLANINRNVILQSLAALYEKIVAGGQLLVSGILHSDADRIREAARAAGFIPRKQTDRGEWSCLLFRKPTVI